ncbi:hypothetical protein O3M35_001261 [Rhynocoris fuscipes]|uniref:Peptidase M14 domain-containing protein n=1 Tax=Rhynocoris fuscipes TaxID=488301 RepID=A0AAW1DQK0_9HEMI
MSIIIIKLTIFILGFFMIISKYSINGDEDMFKYRTYKEINEYLDKVAEKHKDKVKSFTIGYSYENRTINGIRISGNNTGIKKTRVLIDAGIHAREWIGPVVVLYAINQLLENKAYSPLIDKLDWYIVPMLNPDGYVFSMEHPNGDRLWRKNRAPTYLPNCIGVDLNRNFGFVWGGPGSSTDPCNLSYRGTHPYSEPETLAFAEFVMSIRDQLKLYLTYHSSAQAILYPWGFGDDLPADWMDLHNLAVKAEKAMSKVNGTHYLIGSTTSLVGVGAGGSDDWAKGYANIKYVYTIELPGQEYPQQGFHPPKQDLPKIAEENFQGIKIFAEEL